MSCIDATSTGIWIRYLEYFGCLDPSNLHVNRPKGQRSALFVASFPSSVFFIREFNPIVHFLPGCQPIWLNFYNPRKIWTYPKQVESIVKYSCPTWLHITTLQRYMLTSVASNAFASVYDICIMKWQLRQRKHPLLEKTQLSCNKAKGTTYLRSHSAIFVTRHPAPAKDSMRWNHHGQLGHTKRTPAYTPFLAGGFNPFEKY